MNHHSDFPKQTQRKYHLKKQALLTLFSILFSLSAFSQKKILQVKDSENRQYMPFAKVQINSSTEYVSDRGFYVWDLETNKKLVIGAWNYMDTTLLSNNIGDADTIEIYLKLKPEELEEVVITSKNNWLQSKVNAFERWQNGWVFLSKKQLYVTDDNLNLLYVNSLPLVGNRPPKKFYVDALDNLFLLGLEDVQQIYITDSLVYFYTQRSMSLFETQIKPVLAQLSQGYIMRESHEEKQNLEIDMLETGTRYQFNIKHPPLHNCGAVLAFKENENRFEIYRSLDTTAFFIAASAFNDYINCHIQFMEYAEKTGKYHGGLLGAKEQALHSYKTLHAKYYQLYFIAGAESHTLLDPYSNQKVSISADDLEVIKTEYFNFKNCANENYLLRDKVSETKWVLRKDGKNTPILENLENSNEKIKMSLYEKNIRVYDQTIFSLKKNGKFSARPLKVRSH